MALNFNLSSLTETSLLSDDPWWLYILGGADSSKGGRDILNAINDKLLDELAMFMFENKADLSSFKGAKILVKTRAIRAKKNQTADALMK